MSKKFSFSNGFVNKIIEMTEGVIPSEKFELFLVSLERQAIKFHFDNSSESNLLRILSSIYDKTLFINDLVRYPHHPEILVSIAANSNYLTDIVVRNPEYLYQIFDQDYLSQEIEQAALQTEIENIIGRYKSFNSKLNFLKQTKKRYILKIGLADILKINDLLKTTGQLSILAKVITAQLFRICYQEIQTKYSQALDNNKYCLCSLGKLGGNELNYSSDIDLILFYDNNEFYEPINKEFHELLSETALLFIKSSTEITDKGYIYRVDFRLRPDGKYSPLCKSLVDYTKYYELRGEDWERQMLIKLDYIDGGKSLYQNFINFLQPFIYPHSASISLKDQIQKIKHRIEQSNRERENVKLFKGGIRDIEFSVQALQLINGGKYKEIRTGNTVEAVNLLNGKKLLSNKEKKIFLEAYNFYRKIEHFLQLMNDTQTHLIPDNTDLLKKLTLFLGFKSTSEFKHTLSIYRKEIRKIFDSILTTGVKEKSTIEEIPFKDKSRAIKNYSFLSTGTGVFGQKEFDQRTINLFDQIEPTLIKYLKKSSAPDRVLDNLVKVIRSVSLTSIWYNELCDNRFLKYLLTLCEYSDKSVNLIAVDKSCSELLLTRKVFSEIPPDEIYRLTYNQLIIYLSVRLTLGLLNPENFSAILSDYISDRITKIVTGEKIKLDFFIASLGSLSSKTLSFSSDIDLLLVTGSDKEAIENEKGFLKLINLLQEKLKPMAVDFRLRPEGKSSQLIWSVDRFKEYFNTRARVWEFQAYSKLKFVTGNIDLYNKLTGFLCNSAYNLKEEVVRSEIKLMDRKIQNELISYGESIFNIKKQSGGLSTVDFIIDSVLLTDFDLYKRSIGISRYSILYLFSRLKKQTELRLLLNNYKVLKLIELAIQNIFDVSNSIIPKSEEKKSLLANWLKVKHKILLDAELKQIIRTNKDLFKKYVG